MLTTADIQAMEAMAALLPQNDPYRRELEIELYQDYRERDSERAWSLVKTWKRQGTTHDEQLVRRFYREDPRLVRTMVPGRWDDARIYCELWLNLLLADWRQGDGAIAALLITACNPRLIDLPRAPELVRLLPELSESDQKALILPLLGQAASSTFREDAEMLACLLVYAGILLETQQFQEKAFWIAYRADSGSWRRALLRAAHAKKITNPLVRQIRILSLALSFHNYCIVNRPAKVTPKFIGRWRRMPLMAAELDKLPDTKSTRKMRAVYRNLQKGTPRHLQEGAEEYLTKQKSNLNR